MYEFTNSLPAQKIPTVKKNLKWRKKNIDAVESSGFLVDEGVRKSYENKLINYNLYNGRLNRNDVEKVCNPTNLENFEYSDLQHYPIMVPRLELLIGEEVKRRFDFRAVVTNPTAISAKEDEKKKVINSKIQNLIKRDDLTREETQKELSRFMEYMEYEWQDARELRVNRLLRHYWEEHRMGAMFNEGFRDALIAGEEGYQVEIISGEPVIRKLNPLTVHTLRTGNSNRWEDSDIIVIDEYYSPGRIIDEFHNELKPSEIDRIEEGRVRGSSDDPFYNNAEPTLYSGTFSSDVNGQFIDDMTQIVSANSNRAYGAAYDASGNVRVLKVYWRSYRKVKEVTYFDADGDEQTDIFPETYTPKKDEGETAKTLWINEWWEGTKIGTDIYVKMRPKQVQFRKMNNPSYCHPGITGRTYNINNFESVSLVDRMKKYQYLYNAIFGRLNEALARNYGKILELDFSMIPDGWEISQWMAYVTKAGIAVKDPWKEGKKGAATGTISGNLGHSGHGIIDAETGQYINQQLMMLEFIKREMGEISGVTEQRLGQIQNRETVGGVERSVTQSSHVTEYWFNVHEETKLYALNTFVEVAKVALKGKNKKAQYILDDQSIKMFDIDGDEFAENDYGVVVTSGYKFAQIENSLRELAHAALQTDKLNFTSVMDIYMSSSISEIRRKITKAEDESIQRQREQMQAQQEQVQAQIQAQQQDEQAKRELDERKNIRDNETKVIIEQMKQISSRDANNDGIADMDMIYKREIERQKLSNDLYKFNVQLAEEKRQHNDKIEVEKKKITASKTKSVAK